jgi:hypothetical protein
MITIYLVLKISALLAVMLLPLGSPKKKKKGYFIEISNWVVNEDGQLEHLTKILPDHHEL